MKINNYIPTKVAKTLWRIWKESMLPCMCPRLKKQSTLTAHVPDCCHLHFLQFLQESIRCQFLMLRLLVRLWLSRVQQKGHPSPRLLGTKTARSSNRERRYVLIMWRHKTLDCTRVELEMVLNLMMQRPSGLSPWVSLARVRLIFFSFPFSLALFTFLFG